MAEDQTNPRLSREWSPERVAREALEHVFWLVATGRHIQPDDRWTNIAVEKGWAVRVRGVMPPPWSRVALTASGQEARRRVR